MPVGCTHPAESQGHLRSRATRRRRSASSSGAAARPPTRTHICMLARGQVPRECRGGACGQITHPRVGKDLRLALLCGRRRRRHRLWERREPDAPAVIVCAGGWWVRGRAPKRGRAAGTCRARRARQAGAREGGPRRQATSGKGGVAGWSPGASFRNMRRSWRAPMDLPAASAASLLRDTPAGGGSGRQGLQRCVPSPWGQQSAHHGRRRLPRSGSRQRRSHRARGSRPPRRAPPQLKRLAGGLGRVKRRRNDGGCLGARDAPADGVSLVRLQQARRSRRFGAVVEPCQGGMIGDG